MQIVPGSRVSMHFSLRLSEGIAVESSFDDEPIDFVLGDGSLDTGLELALIGLKAGDRQTLMLRPGQAFGVRDVAAIQWLERAQFPVDIALETGQIIAFGADPNQALAGTVVEIREHQVKVDFNHPLAEREVEFTVQIVAVGNAPHE